MKVQWNVFEGGPRGGRGKEPYGWLAKKKKRKDRGIKFGGDSRASVDAEEVEIAVTPTTKDQCRNTP